VAAIIGIDARAAAEVPAGRGRVAREVIGALARLEGDDRYVLYCRRPADMALDERFAWRPVPLRDPFWHVETARRASRECSAFLSTNSYLTAWFTRVPCAVVVYDLVAFIPGARAQKRAGRIERATIDVGARRARALVCISEATRRDLVRRVPSTAPRAVAIPLAAGPPFATSAAAAPRSGRPYVLAAGTLEPRKNLLRLLEAWSRLSPALHDTHDLVLVGPTGWEGDPILARARADGARLTGYIPDDELAALYRGCVLFCYPSLYEGFGLPVLEAMNTGAPVITSNLSSLPEVVGDAAVMVDPLSVDAIGQAIARLLADPDERARLRTAGAARAATFSWERTARELRGVLRRIGSG
jgi:glycosyltransferase involved in cell wall biosynthesis